MTEEQPAREAFGPARAESDDGPAHSKRTLGDVLYAGSMTSVATETEWVALVRGVAARDRRSFRTLYELTHRIVFTLAFRISKNREAAEEVTLDVFDEIWRRAPAYDAGNGTVIGWIMSRARSHAVERWRSAYESFEMHEQRRLLRSALDELDPQERQAVETTFFSGLAHEEVAAHLYQPPGTVRRRIRSGLSKLRQALLGDRQA